MPPRNNPLVTFAQAKAVMAGHVRAYVPGKGVTRFEIKIKPIDQLGWLTANRAEVKIFGASQDDEAAIAGLGEALSVQGKGRADPAKVCALLRRFLSPQYPHMQWYGGFGFDAARPGPEWSSFGGWRFVLPRFELARHGDKMIFCCNLAGKVNAAKLLKELAALKTGPSPAGPAARPVHRQDNPSPKVWQQNVGAVLASIERGEYEKVVLARRTVFRFKAAPDPWLMLKRLKKVTPHSYHFAFAFGKSVFLGASPERLYKRQGRHVWSEALAGTQAGSKGGRALLSSVKDLHEHQLVVEAIAGGLRPLCDRLDHTPTPRVRTLSNGHHLNTDFYGHLKDGVRDEDILQSLHPTPAVGGYPKAKGLAVIRRREQFSRGWYAGPLGYVGVDWAEFVVGIRSGLLKANQLSVFAGAGIVRGSEPDAEWQEIENKISNFIKIIK